MLRYSLATLCLALLYVSVACAALVNATPLWQSVAITMAIAVMVAGTLAAVYWRERAREFAIGFAVTGWIYFILAYTTVVPIRSQLITQMANDALYAAIHEQQAVGPYAVSVRMLQTPSGPVTTQSLVYTAPPAPAEVPLTLPQPAPAPLAAAPVMQLPPRPVAITAPPVDAYSFGNIGHSIWVVLVACLGGAVAQLFSRRSRSEP